MWCNDAAAVIAKLDGKLYQSGFPKGSAFINTGLEAGGHHRKIDSSRFNGLF
jgi:hypothetical protein